jgi:histidinol-phosphate aminotransferase
VKVKLPVRKAILQRRTYDAPAEGRSGKIRLDFNENTTGCSGAVRKAIARLDGKELAMYPEYEKRTRNVAKYFGVKTEEIVLTNGGDDALRVFFDTFVEPGSRVLICEPTFPMYRYYAEIAGAQVETLRYSDQMEFPVTGAIAGLKKKPRVFFLANPNNPTGTLLGIQVIERLLRAAKHTVVVLDEAYSDFCAVSGVKLIHKYPQLFLAKTFSKAAGLAGLRLGAVIARRESLALVRRALPPFPVNVAALVAADAAIREGRTIKKYVRDVKRLRKWFTRELQARGVFVFPSEGNFVLANFGESGPELFRKLASKGILVRARSHDMGPGFARVSIGTKTELHKLLRLVEKGRL